MRLSLPLTLFVASLSLNAYGQQLSAADVKLVDSARARYYNLEAAGFQSLTCSVKFDFSTVPLLQPGNDDPTRRLLEATVFTLTLDGKSGPTVQHRYPSGASESVIREASQVANLLTSLVTGLFQTWPSKGLRGPIPPFNSQIESVISTEDGYTLGLRVPGEPVQVSLDKDYLVTEIVSAKGRIDERPKYAPSAEGLVFAGNDAIDDSEQTGQVEVKYELETSVLDGLRVPSSAHLRVNQNIDVKFALNECAVRKAIVVHVNPPPPASKR
jgi:hypothetical protein